VAALVAQLRILGVDVAVLESDALRPILTPDARYQQADRDLFYCQLAQVGALLIRQGIPVIFDATANRRAYRDRARQEIPHFLEVYLECPLTTCIARDPKGIYRMAEEGAATAVPGVHVAYEPPDAPDVVVHVEQDTPADAVHRIVAQLRDKNFIAA
jgi:adenylylsulfate kinase